MRFLFYAVAAMTYLAYFLFLRLAIIWQNRKLPSVSRPTRRGDDPANGTVYGALRSSAHTSLRSLLRQLHHTLRGRNYLHPDDVGTGRQRHHNRELGNRET